MIRADTFLECLEWIIDKYQRGKKLKAGVEKADDRYRPIIYVDGETTINTERLQIDLFSARWLAEAVADAANDMIRRLNL